MRFRHPGAIRTATGPRTADFSAPPSKNPRPRGPGVVPIVSIDAVPRFSCWPTSCRHRSEHFVFRATVLSIVMTLAVGSNPAVFCVSGCHPASASPPTCDHQKPDSSISLSVSSDCPAMTADATAFIREDLRREASAPPHAILLASSRVAASSTHETTSADVEHSPPLDSRPLPLTLRI